MKDHIVTQGDCVASIAYEDGFHWETLWNHPSNAGLKAARKDPNVLAPGDVVHVPDRRDRVVERPTTQRHRFRLKNTPALLNVRLLKDDRPRKNLRFVLEVDDVEVARGSTDDEGRIQHPPIPPDARMGLLRVTNELGELEVYSLALGHLDPIGTIAGVQGRLRSLGCFDGAPDGEDSPALADAVRRFQRNAGLPETGVVDDALRGQLEEAHGS
jgi:Putative peptidoglycan binding domain